MMNTFEFEVAHEHQILKGYVEAVSEEDAVGMIFCEEWNDIYDEDYIEDFVEGYDIIEIWKVD